MSSQVIYKSIFTETFGVEEKDLNEKFQYSLVESWDSIAHMVLITKLEDEFDIMFETEDILNLVSYTEGMNVLKKYDIAF